MTGKIGVGLVGFGRIAEEVHLPSLRRYDGFELAAVCDMTEARRAKAETLAGVKTVSDLDALLGDGRVKAIAWCRRPKPTGEPSTTCCTRA